jgi:hypothetical protein
MYSVYAGGQVTYMDSNGKPIGYMIAPVVSGPQANQSITPSLVYPMISSSLPGAVSLPSLPELPTLKGF